LLRTREMFALGWQLMASHLLVITQHPNPADPCLGQRMVKPHI
jgi:hypothetical protein